jgi:hypothetical protein
MLYEKNKNDFMDFSGSICLAGGLSEPGFLSDKTAYHRQPLLRNLPYA